MYKVCSPAALLGALLLVATGASAQERSVPAAAEALFGGESTPACLALAGGDTWLGDALDQGVAEEPLLLAYGLGGEPTPTHLYPRDWRRNMPPPEEALGECWREYLQRLRMHAGQEFSDDEREALQTLLEGRALEVVVASFQLFRSRVPGRNGYR